MTRAKLLCSSVKMHAAEPFEVPVTRYVDNVTTIEKIMTWPREYVFTAVYSTSPEDNAYSQSTPMAKIEIRVDNPSVVFMPGKHYFVDFSEVA